MKKDVENFYYLLHPRPVVLICSGNEKINIMACSWITPVSEEPPMITISLWKEGYTCKLIESCKEFTVNIPSIDLIKAVWIAGTKSGKNVDKIALTGLKLSPSKKIKVPIIEDCIGHLECKLSKSLEVGECNLYVGEVIAAYAKEELLEKGVWSENAKVLLHSGGKIFTIPSKLTTVRT
ncbi:MAG: flavin reductase family protein [Candidatus Methanomethylicia archaeon]|jgi:flavin reductase (DIM6/NTAB) family NADH-FMN oxidoreductase RutF|nr:flavin reductase family protein [Candidatus Methanomethylicia archaeon]MCQ5341122.1 flavin reductase family protein [Candidatus Methanomethylicia archaeon]